MTDDVKQRRENDALQSGEGNPAYGQDPRDFGAGRQTTTQPLTGYDEKDRDPTRDRSLDPAHQSAASTRRSRGTYVERDKAEEDQDET
jgi:hypothetical protein